MEQKKPIDISQNMSAHRFEIYLNGELEYVEYHWKRGILYLMRTVVSNNKIQPDNTNELIRLVLKHLKDEKIKSVVYCPLIENFQKRNPEYKD